MTVSRITHENGSPEGANSTYVLPERGIVIDPGPPGDHAWRTLREGIAAVCSMSDINHVLITHWHIDHVGLAARLAEWADASVHCHEADAPLVGDYARERKRRLARDERRLGDWGVPPEQVASVLGGDEPSGLPSSFPVHAHGDGATIAGARLIHTPGHTLGHAGYLTESELFVGDAVLETYTPNVGGSDTRVERALATYEATLEHLRGYNTTTTYPGHGGPLDHGRRIGVIFTHHERRSTNVLDVLCDHERATPWDVATTLFGDMRGIHVKMGAGEAAAHLEYLTSKGEITQVGSDPLRFGR